MNKKIAKVVWIFLLGCLAVWLFFLKTKNCLDSDEGLILGGAWRLFNGEHLYLDFFEYLPPASFYLIYGIWKFFGASYLTASLLAIANILAVLGAIYLIAKKCQAGRFSIFAPILFLIFCASWPLIGHNVFVLAPLAWSTYLFIVFLQKKSWHYLATSGLLAGLTGLFLQHRFLALIGAGLFCLLFFNWRQGIKRALGLMALYSLFFCLPLGFLLFWPVGLLYQNLVLQLFSGYSKISSVGPLFFIIAMALVFLLFWLLGKKRSKEENYLLILQIFLLGSSLSRPDFFHVFCVAFPMLILFLVVLNKKINGIFKEKIIWSLMIFVLVCLAQIVVGLSFNLRNVDLQRRELFSLVTKNCSSGEYTYAGPFLPGFYFELKKKSPSAYDYIFPGIQSPRQLQEAADAILAKRPSCAIINRKIMVNMPLEQDNPVEKYIFNHYEKVTEFKGFEIYKLK